MTEDMTELFFRIFDKTSGIDKRDVEEKALIKALIETGKFDRYNAENHIEGAMRAGKIFERKAGFYAMA